MQYRESKTVFCKIPYYTLAFSVFQVCTKQHILTLKCIITMCKYSINAAAVCSYQPPDYCPNKFWHWSINGPVSSTRNDFNYFHKLIVKVKMIKIYYSFFIFSWFPEWIQCDKG